MTGDVTIDVDSAQRAKRAQRVSGDVFLSRKIREEGRVMSVLSDGLGSGVKAAVLANMTAAMALKYAGAFVDVRKSAKTIMDTLPICQVRKISYSTFTLADVDDDGSARFIEHGNPAVIVIRGGREVPLEKSEIRLPEWHDRVISYAETTLQLGDRVVCMSDGVTQSGMERAEMPMGWGAAAAKDYLLRAVALEPDVSARKLADMLVNTAHVNDKRAAKDDITCGVVHLRTPRRLLVISGPPFSRERDAELAELVRTHPGRKAICGGTTATIVGRLLQRGIDMDLSNPDPEVPPASRMEGVDLITEGTLTLAKVAEMLESKVRGRRNAAASLVELMLESDRVEFVIGTRINDAHQDPNLPLELDLRRNIVRRIAAALERLYLKESSIRFL